VNVSFEDLLKDLARVEDRIEDMPPQQKETND
jgi:hypothetical protein